MKMRARSQMFFIDQENRGTSSIGFFLKEVELRQFTKILAIVLSIQSCKDSMLACLLMEPLGVVKHIQWLELQKSQELCS